MIESDIRGNSDAECEMPICHGSECETHHPECTCDDCCQLTDSFCEDNRDQCEQTHQPSGGKKMMNKLMPILAKAVVTLVFATISVLGVNAQGFDRQFDLNVNLDTPAIAADLNAESIKYLETSDEVDGILDANLIELSDYYVDLEVSEVDQVSGDVKLDRLLNTPLDGEDIQVADRLDIVGTNNR